MLGVASQLEWITQLTLALLKGAKEGSNPAPPPHPASNDPHFSVQCSPTHNELVLLLGDQHNMTAVTVCDFWG